MKMQDTKSKKEPKRAYQVFDATDDQYCVPVVARNAREAKKMAFGSDIFTDTEFTDLRVTWLKKGNVEGLDYGRYDADGNAIDLLKRGLFDYVIGVDCPRCGCEGNVHYEPGYMDDGEGFYCNNCEGMEQCSVCKQYNVDKKGDVCDYCKRLIKRF